MQKAREHGYVFFYLCPKHGASQDPDYRDHANAFIIGHE